MGNVRNIPRLPVEFKYRLGSEIMGKPQVPLLNYNKRLGVRI